MVVGSFCYLRERAVAKVQEGSTELGRGDVTGAILVDGAEESTIGVIRGLGTLVVLGQQGREGLEVQRLSGDLDVLGQLGIVELLLVSRQQNEQERNE